MNNQNKKILIIITKSNFGGAQKHVLELAQNLQKRNYLVQVAYGGDGPLVQKLHKANILTIQIPYLGRDISFFQDFKVCIELFKLFKKEKPNVVHLHSSKIGAIGSLVARLSGIKRIIFTIHGWAFNENRSYLSRLCIKYIYVVTLFLSHASIAVTQHVKTQAQSLPFYFLIGHKIFVVNNGIEDPIFLSKEVSKQKLSALLPHDISQNILIGQIAELHPIKSIETSIQAMRNLILKYPNLKLLIIGAGQEQENLQLLIKMYELESCVFLLGFVDNASQYIKAFDCVCLTSKSEGLPLTLLEAGLAHVPVVASRVGGIPELISDTKSGFLFIAGNVEDFEKKIETVLALTPVQKEKITHSLFTHIQSQYTIQQMIDKTITLY